LQAYDLLRDREEIIALAKKIEHYQTLTESFWMIDAQVEPGGGAEVVLPPSSGRGGGGGCPVNTREAAGTLWANPLGIAPPPSSPASQVG